MFRLELYIIAPNTYCPYTEWILWICTWLYATITLNLVRANQNRVFGILGIDRWKSRRLTRFARTKATIVVSAIEGARRPSYKLIARHLLAFQHQIFDSLITMAMYKTRRSRKPARRPPSRPRNPFHPSGICIISYVDRVPYISGTLDWYPYWGRFTLQRLDGWHWPLLIGAN